MRSSKRVVVFAVKDPEAAILRLALLELGHPEIEVAQYEIPSWLDRLFNVPLLRLLPSRSEIAIHHFYSRSPKKRDIAVWQCPVL